MRRMNSFVPLIILISGIGIPVVGIFTHILKINGNIMFILNGICGGLLLVLVDRIKEKTPKISIFTSIMMITLGFIFFIGSAFFFRRWLHL